MSWHPPVPGEVVDGKGRTWQVRRGWPDVAAGNYLLELLAPGLPGVRAARLRAGGLELLGYGSDPRLPALASTAPQGEVVVHRVHRRAVIRAGGRYLKVFRPDRSADSLARHARMVELLGAEDFLTPAILSFTPGCITLAGLPGRTLFELGKDARASDAVYEEAWRKWSRGWVRQHSRAEMTALRPAVEALRPHTAATEVEHLQRWVDLWLVHAQDVPEAEAQREAVRAAARETALGLLRTRPDPLVWSHGDLHDKQILAADSDAPLGLLDFDGAARAEAAADLANLAVHLDLRRRQGRLTAARSRSALRQVFAAAAELQVTPARLDAYASATRLRLGCLYSFRPPWGALAEDLLRPAEGPLSAAWEKHPGEALRQEIPAGGAGYAHAAGTCQPGPD